MGIRPTLPQVQILVAFLERNPGIAKGLLRSIEAKMETKKKWISLAATLNALEGANKTGRGWAKYWAEKKCALKKQCARLRLTMRRNGGAGNIPELSSLDKRLIALMGGQDSFHDSQISSDPFRDWNQQLHKRSSPYLAPLEDCNVDGNHEGFGRCSSPVAGSFRDSEMQTPSPYATSGSRSRPENRARRHSVARINVEDMDRLAQMEERRVNAEEVTAHALADLTTALNRNSAAVENMANAMTKIAGALEGLSAAANTILQVTSIKLQQ